MSHRFPLIGFARQFRTDVQILTRADDYRHARFTDRMVALDRLAGTTVLVCAAGLVMWLAVQGVETGLLKAPGTILSNTSLNFVVSPKSKLNLVEARKAAAPITAHEVRLLQRKLKALGFEPGTVDGIAGRRTLDALNLYREARNLKRVSKIDRASVVELLD